MESNLSENEMAAKDPNLDSVVTNNADGTEENNMKGKKVDGDPEEAKDQPSADDELVTNESQKGKKVDADPELEQGG